MNNNRTLLNNSIILYTRLVITSILSLFISRLVLQSLGFSDFGLYNVVGGVVLIMAFLNTVMISTTFRFIAFEMGKGETGDINKIFNISLLIHICLALLVILLAETVGHWYIINELNVNSSREKDALFIFRMSIISIVFIILSVPFQGLITAKENFFARAIIEIVKSFLQFSLVLILLYINGDKLRIYSQIMVVVGFVPSLLFFLYCKRYYTKIVRWKFQKEKIVYKEMLGYSGWIMLGASASTGQIQGSAILINNFFNTIINASFGIATQVFTLLKMFSGNLSQAVVPQITKNYSSGNYERTEKLVCYTNKYGFFLLLTISIPILLETEYLLKIWLGSVPIFTVIFCKLMVIKALLESLSDGINSFVQASGKIRIFQLILSSLMILSLPIGYYVYSLGGKPFTILIIFLCIGFINLGLRLVLLKLILNFNIKSLLRISYLRIFLVCISLLPLFALTQIFEESFSRLIGVILTSSIFLGFSVYSLGLEGFEREIVKNKSSHFCKSIVLKFL